VGAVYAETAKSEKPERPAREDANDNGRIYKSDWLREQFDASLRPLPMALKGPRLLPFFNSFVYDAARSGIEGKSFSHGRSGIHE
jgi:hypothetical protein